MHKPKDLDDPTSFVASLGRFVLEPLQCHGGQLGVHDAPATEGVQETHATVPLEILEMEVSRFVELLVSTVFLFAGNIWEKIGVLKRKSSESSGNGGLNEVSNCENPLLMEGFQLLRLMRGRPYFFIFVKVLRCPRGELDQWLVQPPSKATN